MRCGPSTHVIKNKQKGKRREKLFRLIGKVEKKLTKKEEKRRKRRISLWSSDLNILHSSTMVLIVIEAWCLHRVQESLTMICGEKVGFGSTLKR